MRTTVLISTVLSIMAITLSLSLPLFMQSQHEEKTEWGVKEFVYADEENFYHIHYNHARNEYILVMEDRYSREMHADVFTYSAIYDWVYALTGEDLQL
jgi:hypothetical protein